MRRSSGQFAIGLVLGFAASFVIAIAFLASVAVVVFVLVFGLVKPRFAALAGGGLVGAGGTLLVVTLNSERMCAATEDFCGAANRMGFIAITAGVVATGAVLALWSIVAETRHAPEP